MHQVYYEHKSQTSKYIILTKKPKDASIVILEGMTEKVKYPAEHDFVTVPLGLIDDIKSNLTIGELI